MVAKGRGLGRSRATLDMQEGLHMRHPSGAMLHWLAHGLNRWAAHLDEHHRAAREARLDRGQLGLVVAARQMLAQRLRDAPLSSTVPDTQRLSTTQELPGLLTRFGRNDPPAGVPSHRRVFTSVQKTSSDIVSNIPRTGPKAKSWQESPSTRTHLLSSQAPRGIPVTSLINSFLWDMILSLPRRE